MKNFNSTVQGLLAIGTDLAGDRFGTLKAEVLAENLHDWTGDKALQDLISWFEKQQKDCDMQVEEIPLSKCKGWLMANDGAIRHESGQFFFVQGLRVSNTSTREVSSGWDQPIVTQVGFNGGILGLARMYIDSIPHYLVEAKAEPGNPDRVQICPTLQATFSNLDQVHGGSRPKFAEYFLGSSTSPYKILFEQWMSEDGGRLNKKRNKGMIIQLEARDLPEDLPKTFRWVTLFHLKKLIHQNSWVSPHIRGIISAL